MYQGRSMGKDVAITYHIAHHAILQAQCRCFCRFSPLMIRSEAIGSSLPYSLDYHLHFSYDCTFILSCAVISRGQNERCCQEWLKFRVMMTYCQAHKPLKLLLYRTYLILFFCILLPLEVPCESYLRVEYGTVQRPFLDNLFILINLLGFFQQAVFQPFFIG